VVEAELALDERCDPAAVGAAVTVALYGHREHAGACRWPHSNAIELEDDHARFGTLFVATPAEADVVRERIKATFTRCRRVACHGGHRPSRRTDRGSTRRASVGWSAARWLVPAIRQGSAGRSDLRRARTSGPDRSHRRRPHSRPVAHALGRNRERRSAASLSPAVALVPRLRLGIGGAPRASPFSPQQQ
jgi:hypothetical protein